MHLQYASWLPEASDKRLSTIVGFAYYFSSERVVRGQICMKLLSWYLNRRKEYILDRDQGMLLLRVGVALYYPP